MTLEQRSWGRLESPTMLCCPPCPQNWLLWGEAQDDTGLTGAGIHPHLSAHLALHEHSPRHLLSLPTLSTDSLLLLPKAQLILGWVFVSWRAWLGDE